VAAHGQAVLGFLLANVRDRTAADDLLQEVFCRACQSADLYQDQGQERGYLLRIADRLACDWHRRRQRTSRHEVALDSQAWQRLEPAHDDGPLEELTRRENEQQLAAALELLSEPQRRTLLLRYYGDLDFNDIAATLACPVNTVLSHARRGLLALRRALVEKET
jgi:RNA polymerase sigma-70 factor (ECF subfamily)